jgi:low temperature requirement protein LtrA
MWPAIFARTRLAQASGSERARLARDAYSYLHLPMVAGIVFFAFGLETTLHHLHRALDLIPAVGLCATPLTISGRDGRTRAIICGIVSPANRAG